MTFWETIQHALQRAADDARYLERPDQQELTIWHDFQDKRRGHKYYYFIKLRASWLRQISTIVADERNFE
jgi:hypothetical protein